jgi:hypothetical protein
MQRKLIQLSPSTSVISLPKSWIVKNKLSKGAALEVIESDNSIIITSTQSTLAKECTIDARNTTGRDIWYLFDAAYVAGYDVIAILTKDSKQTASLEGVVRYFPGMIIQSQQAKL